MACRKVNGHGCSCIRDVILKELGRPVQLPFAKSRSDAFKGLSQTNQFQSNVNENEDSITL